MEEKDLKETIKEIYRLWKLGNKEKDIEFILEEVIKKIEL